MADASLFMAADAGRRVQPTANEAMTDFLSRHGLRQVEDIEDIELIKCPETASITEDRLQAEVTGIYAGLKMVEAKCMEVDGNSVSSHSTYTNEQLTALNDLHIALVHEYFDFILTSQHPQGSAELERLVAEYQIPARLWLHGLQSHLDVMRQRLPGALEHMKTFLHTVYPLVAHLWTYENQKGGKEEAQWAECLGDLSRYRMAVEESDIHLRETWRETAYSWYEKVVDMEPTTGRLHHHLTILAQPHAVRQLLYYTKSQCVPIPFMGTAESILTLVLPIVADENTQVSNLELAFVKTFGVVYCERYIRMGKKEFLLALGLEPRIAESRYRQEKANFLGLLQCHKKAGRLCHEVVSNVAVILCCTIAEHDMADSNGSRYANAIKESQDPELMSVTKPYGMVARVAINENTAKRMATDDSKPGIDTEGLAPSLEAAQKATDLTNEVDKVLLRPQDGSNIPPEFLPYLHVRLTFILAVSGSEKAIPSLQETFLWEHVVSCLNDLLAMQKAKLASLCPATKTEAEGLFQAVASPELPRLRGRPLPEDWLLRALAWLPKEHFPKCWFVVPNDGLEDRAFEDQGVHEDRVARILWLACRTAIVLNGRYLKYDSTTKAFAEPAAQNQVSMNRTTSTAMTLLRALKPDRLTTPTDTTPLGGSAAVSGIYAPQVDEKALVKKEMARSYRMNYEGTQSVPMLCREKNRVPLLLIIITIAGTILVLALLVFCYFQLDTSMPMLFTVAYRNVRGWVVEKPDESWSYF